MIKIKKKTCINCKIAATLITLLILSVFVGVAISNASNVNISATEVKVKLIRTFADPEEFEKYIGEPKEEQVVTLSKVPREPWIMNEIRFYDPEGNLLSTFSCEWCSVSQSRNGKYIGVLEFNKEFTQLKFTLLDQSGEILWYKDDFHPTRYFSTCEVVISNDGKGVISFTLRDIEAPYSILFHGSKGNVIKEYYVIAQ